MAKISKPKGAPSIDMTPMVDLGFLLVTFFMLSANFRTDEVVVIDIPASISTELMPKDFLQISVDKDGNTFVSFSGTEPVKQGILSDILDKTKIQLTPEQQKSFVLASEIGCKFKDLPRFLDLTADQRKELAKNEGGLSIPTDSTHNELKIWVRAVYDRLNEDGKTRFEKMVADNPGIDKKQLAADMKPKFILKADKDAPYHFVQNVVNTFKDMDLDTKFSFITSMSMDPRKSQQ
jgi:biopolymer transport protein ExbD